MPNPKKILAGFIRAKLLEAELYLAHRAPTDSLVDELAECVDTGLRWLAEPLRARDLGGGDC
jgi:hypothetical protein